PFSRPRIAGTSALPPGSSPRTCSATLGLAPVSAFTCEASLNFSSVVVAAPPCTNFPNRVPVLAKPHDGTSIRKLSRALQTLCASGSAALAPLIAMVQSLHPTNLYKQKYALY